MRFDRKINAFGYLNVHVFIIVVNNSCNIITVRKYTFEPPYMTVTLFFDSFHSDGFTHTGTYNKDGIS